MSLLENNPITLLIAKYSRKNTTRVRWLFVGLATLSSGFIYCAHSLCHFELSFLLGMIILKGCFYWCVCEPTFDGLGA